MVSRISWITVQSCPLPHLLKLNSPWRLSGEIPASPTCGSTREPSRLPGADAPEQLRPLLAPVHIVYKPCHLSIKNADSLLFNSCSVSRSRSLSIDSTRNTLSARSPLGEFESSDVNRGRRTRRPEKTGKLVRKKMHENFMSLIPSIVPTIEGHNQELRRNRGEKVRSRSG